MFDAQGAVCSSFYATFMADTVAIFVFTGSSRIFKVIQSFTVFYGVPPNGILANEGNGGSGCGSFRDNLLALCFEPVFWSLSELQPRTVVPFETCAFRL